MAKLIYGEKGQNSDHQRDLEFGELKKGHGSKEHQKHQIPRNWPEKDI